MRPTRSSASWAALGGRSVWEGSAASAPPPISAARAMSPRPANASSSVRPSFPTSLVAARCGPAVANHYGEKSPAGKKTRGGGAEGPDRGRTSPAGAPCPDSLKARGAGGGGLRGRRIGGVRRRDPVRSGCRRSPSGRPVAVSREASWLGLSGEVAADPDQIAGDRDRAAAASAPISTPSTGRPVGPWRAHRRGRFWAWLGLSVCVGSVGCERPGFGEPTPDRGSRVPARARAADPDADPSPACFVVRTGLKATRGWGRADGPWGCFPR